MYESYAVLGMHYRLTVRMAGGDNGADVAIATATEAYGASSAGNQIPSDITLAEAQTYKGFRWFNLNQFDNDQAKRRDTLVITGSYRPGQNRTNVRNDEDVKTWTTVSAQPSLTENVKIFFWKSPLATQTLDRIGCNFMLEMKYIVQYKDLVTNFRWPRRTGQTDILQRVPADVIQIPNT